MKLIVAPPHHLECPAEAYQDAERVILETPNVQRALKEILAGYMQMKLAIPAKELAKEEVRLAVAYTDGAIETLSFILRGELLPPNPPDVETNPQTVNEE